MGKKKTPKHSGYVKMKDTPWIMQGREIANIGGQGILDNWNKVNVFDDDTKASLEARNNDVYQRAFGDMERQYNNIMNKYAASNYNRFGTLNATAPYYNTDNYQRDFQRQMNDLSYNKAINYENLINNELKRRYNTMDMFGNLYQYGRTPYELDLKNWNIENTNRDIAYQNALAASQNKGGLGSTIGGVLGTAVGTYFGGPIGGAVGGQLGSSVGGMV